MTALAETRPSLDSLAAIVNREHALAMQAARGVLAHAIAAGEALIAIQQQIAEGYWKAWVEENVDVHWSTANDYMRVAHFRDELDSLDIDQLQEAITFLRGRPRDSGRPGRAGLPDLAKEARRLNKAGVESVEIERRLGVSKASVYRWTHPEAERRYLNAAKQRTADARRAREQRQERALKAAVRKQGGAMAELYAMAERMQDVLGQAHREAQSREAKRALSLAGQHYRRMRDEIVKGALADG